MPEEVFYPHIQLVRLHCVEFTPDGKFLLANDLGTDKIHVFSLKSNGQLDKENTFDVELEPGSGPRHLCFSKDGRFAYLINELSGKVTTLFYNGQNLTPIQYIEADTLNAQGSADIHLSPDGKFLYASNRLQTLHQRGLPFEEEKGRRSVWV